MKTEATTEALALAYFKKARHLSPKTAGLTALVRAIATKERRINVLELGAQRSLSKFSLFSDGWSSLVFGTANESIGLFKSVDVAERNCVNRIIDPPFSGHEAKVPYLSSMECALQYIAGPELELFDPFPDLIYLDGPDDQLFTNDVLSYLIPAIERSNQPVYMLIDDVCTKLAHSIKLMHFLEQRGFDFRYVMHSFTMQNHIKHLEKPEFQLTVDQLLLTWPYGVGGLAKSKRVANKWEKAITGITTVKLDDQLFIL